MHVAMLLLVGGGRLVLDATYLATNSIRKYELGGLNIKYDVLRYPGLVSIFLESIHKKVDSCYDVTAICRFSRKGYLFVGYVIVAP